MGGARRDFARLAGSTMLASYELRAATADDRGQTNVNKISFSNMHVILRYKYLTNNPHTYKIHWHIIPYHYD